MRAPRFPLTPLSTLNSLIVMPVRSKAAGVTTAICAALVPLNIWLPDRAPVTPSVRLAVMAKQYEDDKSETAAVKRVRMCMRYVLPLETHVTTLTYAEAMMRLSTEIYSLCEAPVALRISQI